jgi:putative oxidoreductase
VQRLYSMFPNGWPGAGLLLLRLVCGAFIIADGVPRIVAAPHIPTLILESSALAGALFLIVGFWTPVAGVFIVLIELWGALSRTNSFENSVLLATLGAALVVMGPGSHSVDARRYGRKRIQIGTDK